MCNSLSIFENSYVAGVIGSVIASFLTIGILKLYTNYNLRIKNRKFKKIFGTYESNKLHFVLSSLKIRHDIQEYLRLRSFPNSDFYLMKSDNALVKTSKLIAYSDTVSMKYLQDNFSSIIGNKSVITTDEDLARNLEISFITFGNTSFYCTFVLSDPGNEFYYFNSNAIVSKTDSSKIFQIDSEFDYGTIIKYKHINYLDKIWIIVAGIGATGTTGAGWYLANHWKELSELFHDNAFGLVVRVRHNYDGTAIMIDHS